MERIGFVTDSKIGRVESRRGLVVDYGFITGVERDLESLLRAWCAQLKEQGLDTLTIFTSDASAGSGLLSFSGRRLGILRGLDAWHRRTTFRRHLWRLRHSIFY